MFPVSTYEEIVKKERELNEKHIIVLLFVRPSLPGAREIVEQSPYIKKMGWIMGIIAFVLLFTSVMNYLLIIVGMSI